jgi:glycosyltransferase involved in cell wall biosynthesis
MGKFDQDYNIATGIHGCHLFVTNSLTGGGAERATNTLVNELKAKGVQVALAPLNIGELDRVIVTCPILKPTRTWKSGLKETFHSLKLFQLQVREIKPKTLILNCDLPELFGALTLGSFQLIVVEHASKPWPTRKHLGKLVRMILKLRKAKWVSVSNHLTIWNLEGISPIVIPNAIPNLKRDFDLISYPNSVERLIYIGRLSPEKDPFFFLDLVKVTGLKGIIFGDGNLLQGLKDFVSMNNLNVEFMGFTSQVWESILKSDLIIMTSLNEGDGLVFLEAMNEGIPIILRDIPDLRRFDLESKFYFTTAIDFSNRIVPAIDSYSISNAIRERILRPREPETVASSWEKLLSNH